MEEKINFEKYFANYYNLQSDDLKKLSLLSLLYISILTSATFGINTATALFVKRQGVSLLPLMYIYTSIFTSISIITYSIFIDRLNKYKLLMRIVLIVGISVVLARVLLSTNWSWFYSFLYIYANMVWMIIYTQFWTLANEVCDLRQAKRVFPLIIGSGLLGGIFAGFAGGIVVKYLHTENLLFFWALFAFIAYFLAKRIKVLISDDQQKKAGGYSPSFLAITKDLGEVLKYVKKSSYLKIISITFFLYAISVYFLDYQYNWIVNETFPTEDKLTSFYSYYSGVFYLCTFLIQMFAVNKLLNNFGVANVFLVFPAILLSGFSFLFASFKFIPAVYAKFTRDIVGNSIVETAYPLLYNPIEQSMRGRTMAFVEGLIIPLGMGFAGICLFFTKNIFPIYWFSIFGLAFSLLWLLFSLRFGKEYIKTLSQSLRDKSFDVQYLTIKAINEMKDSQAIKIVMEALKDENDDVQIFAVETLGRLGTKLAANIIIDRLDQNPDTKVKAMIIKTLGNFNFPEILPALVKYLDDPDDRVRANVIETITALGTKDIAGHLIPKLQDKNMRVRINAAIALHKFGDDSGLTVLKEMLNDKEVYIRASAAFAIGKMASKENVPILKKAMEDSSSRVRLNAIKGLTISDEEEIIELLAKALDDRSWIVQQYAKDRLVKIGGERAIDILSDKVSTKENLRIRINAVESLGRIKSEKSKDILTKLLIDDNEFVRESTVQVIDKIENSEMRKSCIKCLEKETYLVYETLMYIKVLTEESDPLSAVEVLVNALRDKIKRIKKRIIRIIGLLEGLSSVETLFRWKESDTQRRSYILELLDGTGEKSISQYTLPLLEDVEEPRLIKFATELFGMKELDLVECMSKLSQDQEEWIRACVIYSIGKLSNSAFTEIVMDKFHDESKLVRENAESVFKKMEKENPDAVKRVKLADIMLKRLRSV